MTQQRSAILTYHSIDNSASVISVAPDLFRRQMEWLAASGVPVVPLSRIRESPGAIALSFDDGFRNFLTHGLPVLHACRLPATVFVVTAFCGRANDWPGHNRSVPRLELMDWDEIRQIAGDMLEIGAHGASHADLTRLTPAQALEELRSCRQAIEDRTGKPTRSFAYPYGLSSPAVRALAGREFSVCCGTRLAFVDGNADPADLPRLDAYYLRQPFWFERVLHPAGRAYLAVRRQLRNLRSRLS